MKKGIAALLCVIALLLCACGAQSQQETEASTVSGATAPTTEPVAEQTTVPATTGNKALEEAKSCIGKSVQELYALIGEPKTSDYAASCLGDGEDGNLYYDGFIVYTYREGEIETVRYVE